MNEKSLEALIKLFAIATHFSEQNINLIAKSFVEQYLNQICSENSTKKFLLAFDGHLDRIKNEETNNRHKYSSKLSVKALKLCTEVNKDLNAKQKIYVVIKLIEFIRYSEAMLLKQKKAFNVSDAVLTISGTLNIPPNEYANCKAFVLNLLDETADNNCMVVFTDEIPDYDDQSKVRYSRINNLDGSLNVLRVASSNTFLFRYYGYANLTLNGIELRNKTTYVFQKGASIKGDGIQPIYYSDIAALFYKPLNTDTITYTVDQLQFSYPKSRHGIRKLSFQESSGKMIGIMGGSGVGKTTLLNLLIGNLEPSSGHIRINGHSLYDNQEELKRLIGYIPQQDLLIEELTVYQNLYFNAKLCFSNLNTTTLNGLVDRTLCELELLEIAHLCVGTPLQKIISGGQRKRLNLALELIREPAVLFVDEPTSGLSSADSLKVMDLLKELSIKNRLLFVNIHQPSPEIFKLFDNMLVLDQHGHTVYYGNPTEAVQYFRELHNHVDSQGGECRYCGNVKPEEILELVEAKKLDEMGAYTNERLFSPEELYAHYLSKQQSKFTPKPNMTPDSLPNRQHPPNKLKQFRTFFARNFLSKLSDSQYIIIALLQAPVLAVILGWFSRHTSGTVQDPNQYVFSQNENLPSYLLMSVIVALFIGMIISAEEIIKDRRILKREAFLQLSKQSYLNSKILFLFMLSAIQMFLFVLIGNSIIELKGMDFKFWLVLFSISCFANLAGLNISAGLRSVVAVYITIPLLIIPQILLSGTIIKFDKMPKSIASVEHVPIIGDLTASRWAYEALAVSQYTANAYNQKLFNIETEISTLVYTTNLQFTELKNKINKCKKNFNNTADSLTVSNDLKLVQHELKSVENLFFGQTKLDLSLLDMERFNNRNAAEMIRFIDEQRKVLNKIYRESIAEKDDIISNIQKELPKGHTIANFTRLHTNEALNDMVLKRNEFKKIREKDGRLIRIYEPIHYYPQNHYGRAHLYAPAKRIGNKYMDTLSFNILVLWLMIGVMYFALIGDWVAKTIDLLTKKAARKNP